MLIFIVSLVIVNWNSNTNDFIIFIYYKLFCRYSEGEIRFNLMAIVSDRKMIYEQKIAELQRQLAEVCGQLYIYIYINIWTCACTHIHNHKYFNTNDFIIIILL